MKVDHRLRTGLGKEKPSRSRSLGRGETLGKLKPVDGDLFARDDHKISARRGKRLSSLAADNDSAGIHQPPADGRASTVEEEKRAFRLTSFSC
jgi:hypothetical protein